MSRAPSTLRILALAILLAPAAQSRTWHLCPDGSGDAPSIHAAMDSAAAGDIVSLECGVYMEAGIPMRSGVILRSVDLTRCATIRPPSLPSPSLMTGSWLSPATSIHGIRFEDAFVVGNGGAVHLSNAHATFSNCAFVRNTVYCDPHVGSCAQGGAVFCKDSSPVFYGCSFEGNSAEFDYYGNAIAGLGAGLFAVDSWPNLTGCTFERNWGGGAIRATGTGAVLLDDCTFRENDAGHGPSAQGGGAVHCTTPVDAVRCTFDRNVCWQGDGGAVECVDGLFQVCTFMGNSNQSGFWGGGAVSTVSAGFLRCTFYGNSAVTGGAIVCTGSPDLDNTIVAFSAEGEGIAGGTPTLTCCDVYGNAGGDWVGSIAGQQGMNGNLGADPLFCDPLGGNFLLAAHSPCLPHNSSCEEPIGAMDRGCGPVRVESLSWGRIKASFR